MTAAAPAKDQLEVPARARRRVRFRRAADALVEDVRQWLDGVWRAQATVTLLAIIVATTLVLRGTSQAVDQVLLHSVSTNLNHLNRNPINVLITSAFFVTGPAHFWGFVPFAVFVLAPLERRIGTARWLIGFAAGHVGATLVVAVGLDQAVRLGWVERSVRHSIDVGWSYGTYCLVMVAIFLLPRRREVAMAATVWLAYLCWIVVSDPDYSNWGHLVAGLIGLGLAPALTRRYHRQVPEHAPLAVPARLRTD